jgi:phage tail-like protein
MPISERNDPTTAFNFLVQIDGVTVAAFVECSGLSSLTDVIEYREGSDATRGVRKLPGLTKYPNVTLKRGMTTNRELWNWRQTVVDGHVDRRTVKIVLLDEARNPVARWTLLQAWIAKWEGPHLRARANRVAIETVEIVHERLELELD